MFAIQYSTEECPSKDGFKKVLGWSNLDFPECQEVLKFPNVVVVDQEPRYPAVEIGKMPVMYIEPETRELHFDMVTNPLTPEQEREKRLEAAESAILGLMQMQLNQPM